MDKQPKKRTPEFIRLLGLWSRLVRSRGWSEEYQEVAFKRVSDKKGPWLCEEDELRRVLVFYGVEGVTSVEGVSHGQSGTGA